MTKPASDPNAKAETPEEDPPFLGRWHNIYILLIGQLAVLVLIFWAIARWAS